MNSLRRTGIRHFDCYQPGGSYRSILEFREGPADRPEGYRKVGDSPADRPEGYRKVGDGPADRPEGDRKVEDGPADRPEHQINSKNSIFKQ